MNFQGISIFYLIIDSFLFAGLFVANKFYQKSVKPTLITSIFFSLIIGLVTTIAFAIGSSIYGFQFSLDSFANAALVAVLMLVSQISGVIALSLGNVSLYSQAFLLGGMLLPWFYDLFCGITPGPLGITAVILMIIGIIFSSLDGLKREGNKSGAKKWLYYVLCLVALLCNGSICILNAVNSASNSGNLTTYSFMYGSILSGASIIVLLLLLCIKKTEAKKEEAKSSLQAKPLIFASLYSLCYGFGVIFSMLAVREVNPGLFYPVSNAIVITMTFVIDMLCFRARPKIFAYVGLAIIILAAILFVL